MWLTMKHFLPQLPGAVVDYSCIHQQGGREAVILPVTASLANVAMVQAAPDISGSHPHRGVEQCPG